MAAEGTGFLRAVELRLLRCTIPPTPSPPPPPQPTSPPPPASSLRPLVETVLSSIERGEYAGALSSDAVRHVFAFADSWEFTDSADCAALFYEEVSKSVESFLNDDSGAWLQLQVLDSEPDSDADAESRFALVICIGVAALLAFTQQNVTGPLGEFSSSPLAVPRLKEGSAGSGRKECDIWARSKLESAGSHLLGKFSLLQYLVYAKILLSKIKDLSREGRNSCLGGNKSISWWLCRITFLQQRISEELSSSLYDLLQVYKNETLVQLGKLENVYSYWGSMLYEGEALLISSMAQLEAGILEYKYGRVDFSRLHLRSAEEACGLNLSLTGVLGFRTVHQVDAKSQMILVANSNQPLHSKGGASELTQPVNDSSATKKGNGPQSHGHHECCDILITPRLIENGNAGGPDGDINVFGKDMKLSANQQAVVLAQCLPLSRSQRDDEFSGWEMAPYIEAIDAQLQSCYVIRSFCDILRIRWESKRTRTKQRAFLMMDKLVAMVSEPFPVASERIQFSFGVYIPSIPALRKEYAELSVSCGMTAEALKIFEDLELWDSLIYCYRLLEKKAAAVDLIKARLHETPNDARLWCSLGDVTNNDAHYEKALEVSNNKSARAKRSLARSAYNRGDYKMSKILWESAMAMNSLFPDGWFALGAAALKDRDVDKALDGFTRAVQLDPENGEAWNNVACLHMVKKRSKPAFIAFKEALKFRRNNWQLWENYSQVAFDIAKFQQALEAIKMVLDLSSNKRVDVELLDKLMMEAEERTSKPVLSSSADLKNHNGCASRTEFSTSSTTNDSHTFHEDARETEFLVDMLGNILQQIIRSGGGEGIWGLYARWHKIKGDLTMCSEAYLKQVRSFQGSDLWHDRDRFKRFAHASLQLCKVYMEIASSTRSRRELVMAEMHLRNSVKQAENFSDSEEFRDLQSYLDEVKKWLDDSNLQEDRLNLQKEDNLRQTMQTLLRLSKASDLYLNQFRTAIHGRPWDNAYCTPKNREMLTVVDFGCNHDREGRKCVQMLFKLVQR